MLIFQVYLYYFGAKTGILFPKSFVLNREYSISNPTAFVNAYTNSKILKEPKELVMAISKLESIFSDLNIIMRKSSTSPILKLTVQGERQRC
jgi:phosphomannomutase